VVWCTFRCHLKLSHRWCVIEDVAHRTTLAATSPMHGELSCRTPATTPRRVDQDTDQDGLFSSTPEPRHSYQDSTTTLRAQEQALPFHKGDFQSPFPNGDELVPEPLADSVKMEAGPLLSIIDIHQVECLYSKHWQLRKKALQFLIEKLNANKLVEEPVPSFRYIPLYCFWKFYSCTYRRFLTETHNLERMEVINFLFMFLCVKN
jgi:hypothetical protein